MELIANVPDHPKLKVGASITLKDFPDPSRWWIITWMSNHVREKASLRTDWNNNI